jgi:phage tail sheath protein FI
MPEYLYPGVYVEEIDTGNKPIEGVSTSTVGFLGITARGPITPTFITSYTEFVRTFGGHVQDAFGVPQAYLAYGVEGFFQNGGLRCWIARVTSGTAKAATVELTEAQVSAVGPGTWGAQVGFMISKAGLADPNLFKLTVMYWSTAAAAAAAIALNDPLKAALSAAQVEVFDNLSPDPKSSTYYVGAVTGVSNLLALKQKTAARPADRTLKLIDGSGGVVGNDGGALAPGDFQGSAADPSNPTGLLGLAAIDDISLLCCPDETAIAPRGTIADQLRTQCEKLKDRFAIVQATATEPNPVTPTAPNSKYAAFYYPWLNIIDSKTGQEFRIPPGGHVAGIYARSDNERGVHKDPANEVIRGIDSLQLPIDNQAQSILNPIGVNALRYFKGLGNLVWGGRTTSSDPDWKYINVRRLFIFVEKSIERGTQWVVFEPNDEPTWARVRRSVSAFLNGLWLDGMLQGAKREDAYFVRCDRTTMTQADIDNGRLIVVIGIAPVKPAEFVIFRIGQWTGGSDITEG